MEILPWKWNANWWRIGKGSLAVISTIVIIFAFIKVGISIAISYDKYHPNFISALNSVNETLLQIQKNLTKQTSILDGPLAILDLQTEKLSGMEHTFTDLGSTFREIDKNLALQVAALDRQSKTLERISITMQKVNINVRLFREAIKGDLELIKERTRQP